VLDQVPQVVAHLQRTAQRCRENASYLADLSGRDSGGRRAALYLEAAAQACEEAAHYASLAAPKGRAWAERLVGDGVGQRVAKDSSKRAERSVTPSAPMGPGRRTPSGWRIVPDGPELTRSGDPTGRDHRARNTCCTRAGSHRRI